MTKSIRAPPGSFFVTFGGFLEASGTRLGSFWTPWALLGRLWALILNWFVMEFMCFLHTFSGLDNCIDFDLYFHAFRCHGCAKNHVFNTVLHRILFKLRRIKKPWSFLCHISACQSDCWFNGVGGGGKNTISHTSIWNQSIDLYIYWLARCELALQLW